MVCFQPQPAYPNNPNGSYIQPTTSFPNFSHFMHPQPSVGYPSSNIYSHSIQPQPMHSKSTTSIECPFLKLPETIQFSKMLDDPEGFLAVTPTNSFTWWDTTSTCQTTRQKTLFIIWSPTTSHHRHGHRVGNTTRPAKAYSYSCHG
ncbi:hypothetical protein CEXT_613111 [Caerostris extrusa]|uniref:Uncharacterized protein n=1 Tax=Caerostris extrusa TaxID=172846 RepID=A0AAV4RRM4_CAEEX|nr:hypothetical protein CEXT_613111 [Caerostris extrusa]